MANDASSPCSCSEEQALAVFTSSGEAIRFLQSQMWQVTYYTLAAYVALVAVPELICRNVANRVCVSSNLICAILAIGTAGLASLNLWNLHQQHQRRLDEVRAAGHRWLQVVVDLHGWRNADPPRAGKVYLALIFALFVGAVGVALIDLSRPMVVAWFITGYAGAE